MAQTEQIGDHWSRLPQKQPPPSPLLRILLLTFPTNLTDDDNPENTMYHFLCAIDTADAATLNLNANTLLRYLHPEKNPNTENPDDKLAAQLTSSYTHSEHVVTNLLLHMGYDHCNLPGLRRLIAHGYHCIACISIENTGRHQARLRWTPSTSTPSHLIPIPMLFYSKPNGFVCGLGPSERQFCQPIFFGKSCVPVNRPVLCSMWPF